MNSKQMAGDMMVEQDFNVHRRSGHLKMKREKKRKRVRREKMRERGRER